LASAIDTWQPTVALPVLAWTLPAEVGEALNAQYGTAFTCHVDSDIDVVTTVDRIRQPLAVRCHPS
jgi:antitoxin component of MazEF toxin-antitoxin module